MDGNGLPLSVATTKANAHDLQSALATLDRVRVGNRVRRPRRVRGDKGYDSIAFRRALRRRHIKPAIDHRRYRRHQRPKREWDDANEIRYGRKRWQVEQRIACIDQSRRLDFLFERTRDAYEGFLVLACIRCYLKRLSRCRKVSIRVFR